MAPTVWMDSGPVAVLSTTASPVLMSSDISRRLKDGTVLSVPRPRGVGHYQSFFSRCWQFDQFRSKYLVGQPSKEWWKYVLFFLINTAIIDAFIIMKGSVRIPKKEIQTTWLSRGTCTAFNRNVQNATISICQTIAVHAHHHPQVRQTDK